MNNLTGYFKSFIWKKDQDDNLNTNKSIFDDEISEDMLSDFKIKDPHIYTFTEHGDPYVSGELTTNAYVKGENGKPKCVYIRQSKNNGCYICLRNGSR